MTFLTKDTFVSVGLVLIVVGGVSWLTTMYNDISYLKQNLNDLKSTIQSQITEIKADIKEIKQLVGGGKS